MPSQFEVEQFVSSVERVAVPALLRGQFALAATDVYAFAENRHAELSDTRHVACAPGCAHCCAINVSVLPPEADAIAGFLQQSISSEALTVLCAKLDALYRHTRWLDDEERIMANHRCAFLDPAGCCMIYPVRPLLCRSLTSTNPDDCLTAKAMLAFGEYHQIISCQAQKEIFDAAFVGLGQALKICGLNDRSLRLTSAVLFRLTGEDVNTET